MHCCVTAAGLLDDIDKDVSFMLPYTTDNVNTIYWIDTPSYRSNVLVFGST